MNYWWIGIAIIAAFNVGFIAGLFWGVKRRDDYEPVEHELPRVSTIFWDHFEKDEP